MGASFFDSNVLVYLASGDGAKADRAEAILAEGGSISVQVLNEFANVARRKMNLSWPETHRFLDDFRSLLTVRPLTLDIHDAGLALAERHRISIYDAMIAAAALDAGCTRLWSEDLQHGVVLGGALHVENPFFASA